MLSRSQIDDALGVIEQAKHSGRKCLIAYSGGKDSIVVAHMAAQLGITLSICETSFYFARAEQSLRSVANELGLDVHYRCSLDLAWLRRHPEVIFSDVPRVRSWSFAARQQKTVKRAAKELAADVQIFGRRTEENTVPSCLYTTKAGLQCHPIRDWSTQDVWDYFKMFGITVPWIYSTEFGRLEGNAPFYALNRSQISGGESRCWEICRSLDERYTRERLL